MSILRGNVSFNANQICEHALTFIQRGAAIFFDQHVFYVGSACKITKFSIKKLKHRKSLKGGREHWYKRYLERKEWI